MVQLIPQDSRRDWAIRAAGPATGRHPRAELHAAHAAEAGHDVATTRAAVASWLSEVVLTGRS